MSIDTRTLADLEGVQKDRARGYKSRIAVCKILEVWEPESRSESAGLERALLVRSAKFWNHVFDENFSARHIAWLALEYFDHDGNRNSKRHPTQSPRENLISERNRLMAATGISKAEATEEIRYRYS